MQTVVFLAGVLTGKLLSPDIIILSIIAGTLARTWWHVLIGAAIAATANEFLLSSMQFTRRFDLAIFLFGVVAATAWGYLALYVKRWRKRASTAP